MCIFFQPGGLSDLIGAQKPTIGGSQSNGMATNIRGGDLTPIDSMSEHDAYWYPHSPSQYG